MVGCTGVWSTRLRNSLPHIVIRSELPKKAESKGAQANIDRQQDDCADVRNRGDTTCQATDDSPDHDHRQKQDEPKQAKQNEYADIPCDQPQHFAKRVDGGAVLPVHDKRHEIGCDVYKNRQPEPKEKRNTSSEIGIVPCLWLNKPNATSRKAIRAKAIIEASISATRKAK